MNRLRLFTAYQLFVGESPTNPVLSTSTPEAGYLIYGSTGSVPGASSYTAQWLRDGVAISGATNWFYEVQEADIGTDLSLRSTPNSGSAVTSLAYEVTRAAVSADIPTYAQDRYNTATRRYDFVLHGSARAILMDGTSDPAVGQIYHAATPAAAFALCRAGMADWVLFPSGTTSTTYWGVIPAAHSGISGSYPALIGTYNPADPTNAALWNKGPKHDLNLQGRGRTSGATLNLNAGRRDHFAVTNLKIRVHEYETGTFIQALAARTGLLFDNVYLFGNVFQVQAQPTLYQQLPASGSGTQSVFVFTSRGKAALSNPWVIERITRSGGARLAYVEGVDYTIAKGATVSDYSDGVTVTLTTPIDIALYQLSCFLPHENAADSQYATDIVLNRCSSAYGNDSKLNRGGAQYFYGVRRLSVVDCIVHHCGWGQTHNRKTTGSMHGTLTVSNGVQTVFAFPNMKATVEADISVPDGVYMVRRLNSGGGFLADLTAGVDYTVTVGAPVSGVSTGVTVTLGAPLTAGEQLGIFPFVQGADIYKHNWYCNDFVDAVMFRCISSWDSANAKMTGKIRLKEWTEIRSPIGPIMSPYGNQYQAYPTGNIQVVEDYLQIESTDIFDSDTPGATGSNPNAAGARGCGPQFLNGNSGSRLTRAVMLRQNNTQVGNRAGVIAPNSPGSRVLPGFIDVDKLVQADWAQTVGTGTDGVGNQAHTYTFEDCITDSVVSGTNNILRSSLPGGALKAAIDDALAKNIHTTFRLEMGISVTVDADDKVTEDRVLAYMAEHSDERLWNDLLRYHFNADIITA